MFDFFYWIFISSLNGRDSLNDCLSFSCLSSTTIWPQFCVVWVDPGDLASSCKLFWVRLCYISCTSPLLKLTIKGTRRDDNLKIAGALLKVAFSRFVQTLPGKNKRSIVSTVRFPVLFNFGVRNSRLRKSKAECGGSTNKHAQNNQLHCNRVTLKWMIPNFQKFFFYTQSVCLFSLLESFYVKTCQGCKNLEQTRICSGGIHKSSSLVIILLQLKFKVFSLTSDKLKCKFFYMQINL